MDKEENIQEKEKKEEKEEGNEDKDQIITYYK